MKTGQPDTGSTASGPVPPAVPPPLPQPVAVLLAALSVIMIVGGGVVAITAPSATYRVPALPPAGPGWTPQTGPSAVPGPTTLPPQPAPSGPDALLALDEADAEAQLRRQADADEGRVEALAGTWVPQVSSKCAGIAADIGPGWVPDGEADTAAVTSAEIVAFHASLRERFSALTSRQITVGINRDTGKNACAGVMVWMSLVPRSFSSAAAANSWCDTQAIPPAECGARLVAPGGASKYKGRI